MEGKKEYTKSEIVQLTVNLLRSITIPVELHESVGKPVTGAIGNLRVLAQMLEKEQVAKEIMGGENDG